MKKFINQGDIKHVNLIDVFYLIKELKQTTRKQIEALTSLSWGAVSNITSRLIESGFVVEHKPDESTGPGRTPFYLEVNGSNHCTVGLDVNIAGIKAELVNLKNQSLKTWSCETDYSSKDFLLNCITSLLDRVFEDDESKKYCVMGIGVAMQGIVDAQNGISVRVTQCSGWNNVPLASILENKYHIPVWLEHDPNCILLAHAENSTINNAILLRIDSGIGMSVMLDGRLIGGMGMFEIGHTTIVPNGARCSCGNTGCLEAYVSVNGMEKLSGKPFAKLVECVRAGEPKAVGLFDDMALYLGTSIYNIQRIFNVSDVILCGEVMDCKELFMDKIIRINKGVNFSVIDVNCASYGAAVIAIDKAIRNIRL